MMNPWFVSCLVIVVAAGMTYRIAVAQDVAVGEAETAVDSTAKEVRGPLADYIAKEDPSYRWVKVRQGKIGTTEYAELILTSQTWRDIVWKHRLFVIKPSTATNAKEGVLVIAGGGWKDEYEDPDHEESLTSEARLFTMIADQLKSPVAVLLNVPQQPLFDGLVEDEIISLTFDEFLSTQDPEWPLLLPMVKSAVRGMDAVQEFCASEWSIDLESFTVTGASKRGWTTWLAGAADDRVIAIAPMVIDMLNMVPQMEHQLDAWGAYSDQIEDYTRRGIQERMKTPAGRALQGIVDPFAYREVLSQPKLIIIGTNDRYWPIDALNLYWEDLVGPKHILYIPNNRHGLKDFPRILGSLTALHESARGGVKLPRLRWSFTEGESSVEMRVESDLAPQKVQVWLAQSQTRDFRNSRWKSTAAELDGDTFVYELDVPESGYVGMFGEAVYDHGSLPFYLSTNVRLVPSPEVAAEATADNATNTSIDK